MGPRKIFKIMPFSSWENAFFDIERALQKWNFRSFAEKDWDRDLQVPFSSCTPGQLYHLDANSRSKINVDAFASVPSGQLQR